MYHNPLERRRTSCEESQVRGLGPRQNAALGQRRPQKLWEDVVQRSKTREVTTPADPKDLEKYNARVEKAALAALAVGDVRKALQQLNSAPIAPTCEDTHRKLVDLNPPPPRQQVH